MHCPKCKSKSFYLDESFTEVQSYAVVNGVLSECLDSQAGEQIGMRCYCEKCEHGWKPRGVHCPDDVREKLSTINRRSLAHCEFFLW